jgi:hypothetical protein
MNDLDRLQTFFSMFSQYRFRIPDYQRGYAWGENQWRELLEDISTLTDDNEHFTGLLVLHENNDPAMRVKTKGMYKPVYDVVDGQQRLTTIVILLNEIRLEMLKLNTDDMIEIAKDIREIYLYEPGSGNLLVPKLVLDSNNHDFYMHNILEMNGKSLLGARILSHENLLNAQKYFRKYLHLQHEVQGEDYFEWLETLYGKVINQMKVMVYRLRTDADAGVVFEAMNSRGKKPTQMDLVKNYLLYLASKLDSESRDQLSREINQTWKIIFEQLSAAGRADDEDTLLEMHWLTNHDHDRRRWASEPEKSNHVKKYFKPMLVNPELHNELHMQAEKYVRNMRNVSVAFSDLSNPTHSGAFKIFKSNSTLQASVINSSYKLFRLGILRPFTPILIAIRLRFPDDAEKYLDVVKLCEKYAFRVFRVANGRTNSSEAVLFRLANQLYNGKLHYDFFMDEFRRDLLKRCPDGLFNVSFSIDHPNPWYKGQGLKYFLYEYEEHLFGNQAPLVNWDTILKGREKTIEHILPQNPDPEGDWFKVFSPDEASKYNLLLGNLTLTEDNSSLGNKAFDLKKGRIGHPRPCYANSNLKIERELAALEAWTPAAIEQRQQHLAQWALERWQVEQPAPLPDDQFEALKLRAEANGLGAEFMHIYHLAERLKLIPKANKHRMSYKSPRNYLWSVLKIYTYASGIDASINFKFFPTYPAVNEERIRDIFDNKDYWWLPPDQVPEFIGRLEQLADEVESQE